MAEKRPKHPRKEGEDLLQKLEEQNWRVTKGKKYFKARCPCGEHQANGIYLTPANDSYFRQKLTWFKNHTCYSEGSK